MPMMKEASGLEVQAKAFAYADYCTISFRVVPISILHQMTTSMSSSPACRIAIGTRVRTQLSTLKMNSSGGPRVVGWHELTNGQGEDAQGGQASAGTVDAPCPLCSCAFVVVGRWSDPWDTSVIAGEGNERRDLAEALPKWRP